MKNKGGMKMTYTQTLDLEFIKKYVTEKEAIDKLVDYLERHEVIGEEIFSYLGEKYRRIASFSSYTPVNKEVFIRRIPFYFYEPDKDAKNIMSIEGYLRDIFSFCESDEYCDTIEKIYLVFEKIFYNYQLDLAIIFEYPFNQPRPRPSSMTETLIKWEHYLDLASSFNIEDKTPKYLITEYKYLLEKAGLEPIIYEISEHGYFNPNFIGRESNILKVNGIFPCDKDGQPILRWLGLEIEDAKKIWTEVNEELRGTLYIETTPFTSVWGLNCWGCEDDGSDAWYRLYIGPQLMEFDYKKLKSLRQDKKLTQQQVSDAIGATIRTYQKWESGTTCPDCRYLLRLMNVLDIETVQDLTMVTD